MTDQLTPDQRAKMQAVFHCMTKRFYESGSLEDVLEYYMISVDDWEAIKKHIKEKLNVEVYQ